MNGEKEKEVENTEAHCKQGRKTNSPNPPFSGLSECIRCWNNAQNNWGYEFENDLRQRISGALYSGDCIHNGNDDGPPVRFSASQHKCLNHTGREGPGLGSWATDLSYCCRLGESGMLSLAPGNATNNAFCILGEGLVFARAKFLQFH